MYLSGQTASSTQCTNTKKTQQTNDAIKENEFEKFERPINEKTMKVPRGETGMQQKKAWRVRRGWNILLLGEHRARKRKLMIFGGHYAMGASGRENLGRAEKQTPKNKPRRPGTECFCRASGRIWLCTYLMTARRDGAGLEGSGF